MENTRGVLSLPIEERIALFNRKAEVGYKKTYSAGSDSVLVVHNYDYLNAPIPSSLSAGAIVKFFESEGILPKLHADRKMLIESRVPTQAENLAVFKSKIEEAKKSAIDSLFNGFNVDDILCGKLQFLTANYSMPRVLSLSLFQNEIDSLFHAQYLPPRPLNHAFAANEISTEEFSAQVAELDSQIAKHNSVLSTLDNAPGRYDEDGRDMWMGPIWALTYCNAMALSPCDALGRATSDPAILSLLKEFNIPNAAPEFADTHFTPSATRYLRNKEGNYGR